MPAASASRSPAPRRRVWFRWKEAEVALSQDFSPSAIDGLTVEAEGMMGDIHGTPEYRANLVKVLTARAVAAAG